MKNKIIIKIILFIVIILTPNIVSATKVELLTNQNEIEAGEEVTIVIKVKEIDIEEGINSLQGQFIYNKEDWEQVTSENIKGKNNWSIVYNDENSNSEGKFILINLGEGKNNDQELCEIKLKAKNKIVNSESEIKLIDLYTTDGEQMIELQEENITIHIQANQQLQMIVIITGIILIVLCFTILVIGKKYRKKVNK